MNVYITKVNGLSLWNTSQYRQWMTVEIAEQLGLREMGIFCYNGSNESFESLRSRIDGMIAGLSWGEDVVICQFPTGNGFKFEWELVSRLKLYRCRVVIFNNAPEAFICESDKDRLLETIKLYNQAEVLIIPSLMMRRFLLDNGIRREMKFVIQEMWDYIIDMNFFCSPQFRREIHFVGNNFAGVDKWNNTLPLKLYAASAKQGENIHSMGELPPGDLVSELSKGGFGLVWYQDEDSRRCMEYGASFTLTRYLAAGIPVIVPVGISNQMIIEKNHLGLVVNSLEEAVAVVEDMTEAEYQQYTRAVRHFAHTIKNGYYTKSCLINAVHAVCVNDAGNISVPANIYNPGEQKFTYTVLKESYGGNLALSWSYHGEADGFLVYDTDENLIWETRNLYQHYFLIKGHRKENGFIVKAYVDTWRGKLAVAKSEPNYLQAERHGSTCVSVVMPAYNSEDYIVRSIDTALAQSLSDMELIIVDDGSTDRTPGIVDWYADRYSNVKVIHQKNGGVAAARNTGIEYAKGEYIGFMDNDDMIRPEMMSRLYSSAKKNECDIAITSIYVIKNGKYEMAVQYPLSEDSAISTDVFLKMHFERGLAFSVLIWNRIYRASLVKQCCLIPQIVGDDDAWGPCIISYADNICYLDDCSYEYDRTIRGNTLVNKWESFAKEERFSDYKKIVLFFLENGNPKQKKWLKELAKRYLVGLESAYKYDEYGKLWKYIEANY